MAEDDQRTLAQRLQQIASGSAGVEDPPIHRPIHTAPRIKQVVSKGLQAPYKLTDAETRELCHSVMAHITRREAGEAE